MKNRRTPRNWLAVHAHFRTGSGAHGKVSPPRVRRWSTADEWEDDVDDDEREDTVDD